MNRIIFKAGWLSALTLNNIKIAILPIACSIVVLILSYLSQQFWFSYFIFNEPLHSTMEAIGALASLLMGIVLLQRRDSEDDFKFLWMITGLFVMNVLDGFHAIVAPSDAFVLLHSASVFFGGLFFSFMWFSEIKIMTVIGKKLLWFIVLIFILFSIWILSFPETMPRMIQQGEFTLAAFFLNMFGGALFIVGAAFFLKSFYQTLEKEFYWFTIFSLLIALSGIAFVYGDIWSSGWWFWHVVRLVAFIVVLLIVILNYRQSVSALQIILNEYKQSEKALKESKTFNETILNATPNVIYLYDLIERKNIYSNEGISKILGYSVAELKEMGEMVIPNLMHPDDFKIYLKETFPQYQSAHDSEIIEHEYRMKHKNGGWHWLRAKELIFLRQTDGTPKQIFGIISDITEQKLAEEDLRIKDRAIDTSINGVAISDLEGKLIYVNLSFRNMWGYSEEDVLCGKPAISFWENENDPGNVISLLQKKGSQVGEMVAKRKDGSLFDAQLSAHLVKDEKGNPLCMMSSFVDITERKRAEESLQKSEEKFKSIAENIPGVVAQVLMKKDDSSFSLPFVSDKSEELYGYSADELQSDLSLLFGMYFPEEFSKIEDAMKSSAKALDIFKLDYRIKTKNGKIKWVRTISSPQKLENEDILWNGVTLDITKHKRVEQVLQESEARYRELFDNISSGVAVYEVKDNGKDFIFKDFNKTAERIDGDKKEDLIGKSIFDMRPNVKEFGLIDVFQKVWKTGKPTTHPITLYQDEKLTGWYENFVYKLPSDEIVAVFDDITGRKQAEEEIKKFRTISDMAVHGNAIADLQGNITYINKYFARIHGYAPEELIGRNLSVLHNKKQMEKVRPSIESLIEKENFGPIEIWHTHKDSTEIPMLMSGIIIKDKSGNPQHMASTAIDITAIKQIQEVLATKNKELESYLYATSHDLRSPLVNIQGFSKRLQKQTDAIKKALSDVPLEIDIQKTIEKITDKDIPKSLGFILTSVSKIDILISGLLRISRTGRAKMTIQKIDMNNIMEKIIRSFRFQIEESAAETVVENLPDCYGDANMLNQLFSNIIGNAIKYRDKKRQLVITVAAQKRHNKIIYSLKDTGVGIAPKHLEKIWDVFYRADSLSPETGEGIGLNIVKRITDKHKGKIRVESEEGRGSAFYIELPGNEFSE